VNWRLHLTTAWSDRRCEPPRVLDLFCGAGGLSEGFRQAGYRIVGGVDSDPDAIATYSHNFPEAVALCGDLSSESLRAELSERVQYVDVLVGVTWSAKSVPRVTGAL
jgi:DNA (cytosine-5)-methyltransferase 1